MQGIWEQVKNEIHAELPKSTFSLWIKPLNFIEVKGNTLVLGCPNRFSCGWLKENYLNLLQEKITKAASSAFKIILKVENGKNTTPSHLLPEDRQLVLPRLREPGRDGKFPFNRNFTFDHFVVGPSNEFAYSASKEMTQGTPTHYQTLLMLAKTGLGKSHLSQAVGHQILEQRPNCRLHYITAEEFTNEMVYCLKNDRIETFKEKYRRGCDVLLLEEIHFLSGKEKIQLELSHTLDALANDRKKIVFTSAMTPGDIPRMSRELTSRLTSGLVARIEQPDTETRLRILTKKAAQHGLALSSGIIHLLAEALKRDIRQMESVLKCLKAKSELLHLKIDQNLAKEVLKCFVSGSDAISLEEIKKLVCTYYKVDPEMLQSKSRKKAHTTPRNIYIYLSRNHTDETLDDIAKSINRTHSTVLYATEVVEQKIKKDEKMGKQIHFLRQKLEEMKK